MANRKLTTRGIIQTAALFLLLVFLPLGSWYFLQSGVDYRKSALDELQEFGEVPMISYQSFDLDKAASSGKMLILGFLDDTAANAESKIGERLAALHDQFDNRQDVLFLNHVNADQEVVDLLKNDYKLDDAEQCYFSLVEKEAVANYQSKYPGVSDFDLELFKENVIAITDTSHQIRQYYNLGEAEEMKRLIQHIAIILPIVKKRR